MLASFVDGAALAIDDQQPDPVTDCVLRPGHGFKIAAAAGRAYRDKKVAFHVSLYSPSKAATTAFGLNIMTSMMESQCTNSSPNWEYPIGVD